MAIIAIQWCEKTFLVLITGLTTTLCTCKKSDYKSFSNLTESEIEDCLQFAKNPTVSYYKLLMSDNRNLAEIISKTENKQAKDIFLVSKSIPQETDFSNKKENLSHIDASRKLFHTRAKITVSLFSDY